MIFAMASPNARNALKPEIAAPTRRYSLSGLALAGTTSFQR
jgi:hypothetical protein